MDITSYMLGKKSGGGSKPPVLQDKEVTITENGTTSVTADEGYDGLSEVEVTADIPPADIGDYFNDTGSSWKELVKKIPGPIHITGTSANYAFDDYKGTELPKITLASNVTSMENFFYGCTNLKHVDLSSINTNYVTSIKNMFYNCQKINQIDLSSFSTSNVTNMSSVFHTCSALTELDISNFDMGKVTNINNFLYNPYANKLEDLKFGYDLGKGYLTTASANYNNYTLDLNRQVMLTHDSLMSVINNLYDIASAGVQPQKLVLGATNLAKLTADEIAIATNKGWTVS